MFRPIVVLFLFVATTAFAQPLTREGSPVAEIVLEAETPAAPVQYAADELRAWVKRITGAELPIVQRPGDLPVKIYLGTPATSPTIAAVVERSFGQDLARIGKTDGFAVRRQGENIYIFAAEPKGVLNGVYRFLERNSDIIFVRAMKAEDGFGTIYSKMPTLTAEQTDLLEVPAFRTRAGQGDPAWRARLLSRERTNLPPANNAKRKAELDRYGTIYAYTAHGIQPNEFKDKPEFFALFEGKRQMKQFYSQLCYSNPELAAVYLDRLRAAAKANPDVTTFDAQHADNWRVCECPDCTKPYTTADGRVIQPTDPAFRSTVFFDFTNRAAEMLEREFPGQGKEMHALAYVWSNPPSATKLADNLVVFYAPFVRDQRQPIFHPLNAQWHKTIDGWMKQHKNIELFEYYFSTTLPWFYYPASDVIAEDLRYYAKNGMTGGMYQDGPVITTTDADKPIPEYPSMTGAEFYDLSAMEFWVTSKLYWDPSQDVEGLRDEFCRRAYREAVAPMRKFFATIREAWLADPSPNYYSDDPTMAVRNYIVERKLQEPLRALLVEAESAAVHPGSKELVLRGRRLFEKWLVAEQKLGARVTLDVPFTQAAPSDDLDFNSPTWQQAAVIDGYHPIGKPTEPAATATRVRALHDRKNLYLAFDLQETPAAMEKLKAQPKIEPTVDDWNAMGNTYVEMFFDGDQKPTGSYYQLAFGANDCRYDGKGYSNEWTGNWSVKTAVGDTGWRAVLTLPLETIGVDVTINQKVGAMLLRADGTSWQGGNVHQPAGFQTLRLKLD